MNTSFEFFTKDEHLLWYTEDDSILKTPPLTNKGWLLSLNTSYESSQRMINFFLNNSSNTSIAMPTPSFASLQRVLQDLKLSSKSSQYFQWSMSPTMRNESLFVDSSNWDLQKFVFSLSYYNNRLSTVDNRLLTNVLFFW